MARTRKRRIVQDYDNLPLRHRAIMYDLQQRFRWMNVAIAADFHFNEPLSTDRSKVRSVTARRNQARKVLSKLTKSGCLKCFSILGIGKTGRPQKVYCLPSTRIPGNTVFIPHDLKAIRMALTVRAAGNLQQDDSYVSDFRMEYDLVNKKNERGDLRPDFIFTVGNSKGCGLFLCEVDLSTEPLNSEDRKRATIRRKFENYIRFQDWDIKKYCRAFQREFAGFRVIVVTRRPASIIRTAEECGTGDVVGIADLNEVNPTTLLNSPIWTVPGLGTKKFKLNWAPEHVEAKP